MNRIFEQNGLTFAYVTEDDLPDLRNMLAKATVCEYLCFGPNSDEETDAFFRPIIEQNVEAFDNNELPREFMFVIRKDSHFVGYCGLIPVDFCDGNYLIGFAIDDAFWRCGYGEAACRFLVDFSRQIPGLYRVSGDCMSGNDGSQRIMEKCGFQFEGTQKRYWFKNGKYHDNLLFGLILKRESHERN